ALILAAEERKEMAKTTINMGAGSHVHGALQIQQNARGSTQVVGNRSLDLNALRNLIAEVRAVLPDGKLDQADRLQVEAEIQSVDAQSLAPKPNQGVIRESLRSIRAIFESASGSAVFEGVRAGITLLLEEM